MAQPDTLNADLSIIEADFASVVEFMTPSEGRDSCSVDNFGSPMILEARGELVPQTIAVQIVKNSDLQPIHSRQEIKRSSLTPKHVKLVPHNATQSISHGLNR